MNAKRTSVLYRLAMIGAMIVVGLNTWLATRELHILFAAQGWRAHTLEVITHTKALEQDASKANSAVRGYLLGGRSISAQRYSDARVDVGAELNRLQTLTADNTSQQQRIAYLRSRIAIKFAALDAGLALRKGPVQNLDQKALEPVLNDMPDNGPTLSYVLQGIEAEENRLLVDRTHETQHAQQAVWASFIGASILDIILILVAFEFLIRIGRDRYTLADRAHEIQNLVADLQQVNASLEARVALRTRELELANQELEAFSYSVSHDLRAPLRTIDGFSLALQEDFADKLNDEGRDFIFRVRSGVQRMGQLIDALLQLSRVTRSELSRESVDLSQLATLVFSETQAADPDRPVAFTARPGVIVQADPRLLRIALENLIGNAFKFTSKIPDARIEFGSTVREGKTVYFIRDNGAGFDMKYVDRLFTAFQRLHGDREFKGSGIGLATVSRIIRRHHGTIAAESLVGQGTTFYFTVEA